MVEVPYTGTSLIYSGTSALVLASVGPYDITLSSQTVAETSDGEVADGTLIGILSATGGVPPYTFSISGADAAQFEVVNDNELRAATGNTLAAGTYDITLEVEDNASATSDEPATITVTDYVGVAPQSLTFTIHDDLAAGARTNVPFMFGVPLKTGGSEISGATTASGATLAADIGTAQNIGVASRCEPNGNLGHAVVGGVLASLSSGGSQDITISTTAGSDPSGTSITWADVIATGWNCSLEIVVGGTTYTGNLNTISASDTTYNVANPHYRGKFHDTPYFACFIVSVPIKDGSNNRINDELRFQAHVYAWKAGSGAVGGGNPIIAIMTDAMPEFASWNKSQSCPLATSVVLKDHAGSTVKSYSGSWRLHCYEASDLWQDGVWWSNTADRRDGWRVSQPQTSGKLDAFADSGWWLPGEHNSAVIDPRGAAFKSALDSHTFLPLNSNINSIHEPEQGSSGSRPDINIIHEIEQYPLYSDTADNRDVAQRAVGLGFHLPYRIRAPATGLMINIEGAESTHYAYGGTNKPAATNGTSVVLDMAHAPFEGYALYLLTGRFKYLEECHFRAASTWANDPYGDGLTRRIFTGEQARKQAWAWRNMFLTLAITPNAMGSGITGWTRALLQTLVDKGVGDCDDEFVFNYHGMKSQYWSTDETGAIAPSGKYDNDDAANMRFLDQSSPQQVIPWQHDYAVMVMALARRLGILNSDGVSASEWVFDMVHRWRNGGFYEVFAEEYFTFFTDVGGSFPKTLARTVHDCGARSGFVGHIGQYLSGLTGYTVDATTPSAVTITLLGASVPGWFDDGEGSAGGTRGDWFKGTGAYSGWGALWVRCRGSSGLGQITAVSSDGKTVTIDTTVTGGATPSSGTNINPASEALGLPSPGPNNALAKNILVYNGSNENTSLMLGAMRCIDLVSPGKANMATMISNIETRLLSRTTGETYHQPMQAGDNARWVFGA